MRVLIYDIETIGERGWYFPPRYETNILYVDHYEHLLCVSWCWYDLDKPVNKQKIEVIGLIDFPGYVKRRHDDKRLAKHISELFSQADIVIAHNGDQFDQKIVNARLATHHLKPPAPYKQVDTKKIAKRYFRFPSNSLDDLSKQLHEKRKLSHGDFEHFWLPVDQGKPEAWKKMKDYNVIDVQRLIEVYKEFLPWIENHPPVNMYLNRPSACPNCGSTRLHSGGWKITKTRRYRRYQCQDCGRYCSERTADKELIGRMV